MGDRAEAEAAGGKTAPRDWDRNGLSYQIHETEIVLLNELRDLRRKLRQEQSVPTLPASMGQRIADRVATVMGSWGFIIIQSIILAIWVLLNLLGVIKPWDPYPFILLNLALSFQAAYAAPIIMMSQNRQAEIDRADAQHDYQVNVKAELEIELLHHKLDQLRQREVLQLHEAVAQLRALIDRSAQGEAARKTPG